jgi:hypothetical protein
MSFVTTALIIGAFFIGFSMFLTIIACMLSSRINQTEEYVDLLVYAVNKKLTNPPKSEI